MPGMHKDCLALVSADSDEPAIRYIVADQARKLIVMCRQLRIDLRE